LSGNLPRPVSPACVRSGLLTVSSCAAGSSCATTWNCTSDVLCWSESELSVPAGSVAKALSGGANTVSPPVEDFPLSWFVIWSASCVDCSSCRNLVNCPALVSTAVIVFGGAGAGAGADAAWSRADGAADARRAKNATTTTARCGCAIMGVEVEYS
jgi:hypothetical protein